VSSAIGGASSRTWSELLAAGVEDTRPWLLVPSNPSLSSDHACVSFAELAELVTGTYGGLHELGACPGDRMMVVADNSLEASVLLLAVMASGMVAVPVAPRTLGMDRTRWHARLRAVALDCTPTFVLGRRERLPDPGIIVGARSCAFEELRDRRVAPAPLPMIKAEDVALIQYTSGTTDEPRGAVLTHSNIFHNLCAIGHAVAVSERDVVLTWLPLFHDMGLIGSLLFATYFRLPLVLMTPTQFLLRPESWLWAISRFRVSCCAAPNSAYHSCAVHVPDHKLRGLDLSCWRAALNGSELVHTGTVDAFRDRFSHYGFAADAMLPVYGLAEHTVAATLSQGRAQPAVDWVDRSALETGHRAQPSADKERSRGVVCVGPPLVGHAVRVVDDSGNALDERQVGAIEARGPSVMRGYHGDAAATALALDSNGWLRTGDRGYLLGGELHVVGRSKEVINRAGRKFDAADLASAARGIAGIRAGRIAFFGVPNESTGTEDVVVMAETESRCSAERERIEGALTLRLHGLLGLRPDRVVLVMPGAIPRTTSGKVQHLRARADYIDSVPQTLGLRGGASPSGPLSVPAKA
jgi:acyl-CoA synthetase (AMP-forming)/AMP-acid ligase II